MVQSIYNPVCKNVLCYFIKNTPQYIFKKCVKFSNFIMYESIFSIWCFIPTGFVKIKSKKHEQDVMQITPDSDHTIIPYQNQMCVNAKSTLAIKLESVACRTALVKDVWQLFPQHKAFSLEPFNYLILHFVPKHRFSFFGMYSR